MTRHMDMHEGPPPPPDTYNVEAYCHNCEYEGEAEIPKGTKVDDADCPRCGCDCLQVKAKFTDDRVEAAPAEEVIEDFLRWPPSQLRGPISPAGVPADNTPQPQWYYCNDDSTLRHADLQPPTGDRTFAESILRAAGGTIHHQVHPDGRHTLNGREITLDQLNTVTSVDTPLSERVGILGQIGVIPPGSQTSGDVVVGHYHNSPPPPPLGRGLTAAPMDAHGVDNVPSGEGTLAVGSPQVPPGLLDTATIDTTTLDTLLSLIDEAAEIDPTMSEPSVDPDEPEPVNTDPRLGDPDGVPWEDFR